MYNVFYYAQVLILLVMLSTILLYRKDKNIVYKINCACFTVCSTMFILIEYIVRNVVKGYVTDSLTQTLYFFDKPKNSYTFIFWILIIIAFTYIIFSKKDVKVEL